MVSALIMAALFGFALIQGAMPQAVTGGGPTEMDRSSEKFKQIVEMASYTVSYSNDSPFHLKTTRVLEATQEALAGVLYTLRLEMKYTTCLKTAHDCSQATLMSTNPLICTVHIVDWPWDNGTRFENYKCKPSPSL